jgi:hypothetical protein
MSQCVAKRSPHEAGTGWVEMLRKGYVACICVAWCFSSARTTL